MLLSLLPHLVISVVVPVIAADSASDYGTFAWLSDAHLDQFYGTPSAEIHKTGAPCNETDAPTFSSYGCGSSLALVTAAMSAAANATNELGWPSLDFVLFTGDNSRHNNPSPEGVLEDMNTVQGLFHEYFPDTQLISLPTMDLGNNDFTSDYYLNVTSHEPCLPTYNVVDGKRESILSYPVATNEWLQTVAEVHSVKFANELEKSTFACGGYLNHEVSQDFNVIILNTIVWAQNHQPTPSSDLDKADPFGQWAWLDKELLDLRDAGKKVYITGHLPPMLQSYTGSIGDGLYQNISVDWIVSPQSNQLFYEKMDEYRDIIAGFMFGHVHSNELRHIYGFPGDVPPLIIGGSIAPCYTTDPTFQIVKFDKGNTFYPIDMATFNVDLSEEIPANITNPFTMKFGPSLVDYLGMESLTNFETMKLANKMLPGSGVTDQDTWDRYFMNWYKGAPQTKCDNPACQRGEACLVACGFDTDVWNSCNASSTGLTAEVACGFKDNTPPSSMNPPQTGSPFPPSPTSPPNPASPTTALTNSPTSLAYHVTTTSVYAQITLTWAILLMFS